MLKNNFLHTYKTLQKLTTAFQKSSLTSWNIPKFPCLDVDYFCNPKNAFSIKENIKNRKGVGDIDLVQSLKGQIDNEKVDKTSSDYRNLTETFYSALSRIPNNTDPKVVSYGDKPKVIKLVGTKKGFDFPIKEFQEISKKLNLVRTEMLGNVAGNRSYYILGELAELEQALIMHFSQELIKNGYKLISVPDLLPREIIERCGMNTRGERNQVYTLDPILHEPDVCLSGTSEMALAGYLVNSIFDENELPLRLCSVSRCYRAETSSIAEERGIFRVHEFTKVEMFVVTTPEDSENCLEQIRAFEERNFESLGLHFQVLDMPACELGAQAYRKYDIEVWMPGRKMYGEISSCSNCTDYQSRRLNIRYKKKNGELDFVHTLNGTACAIPRLLIGLVENEQNSDGTISIPEVLKPYMRGLTDIGRQKKIPALRLVKNKR